MLQLKFIKMKCLKFQKDNILNWEGVLIQTNVNTEVFGLIKFTNVEPMNPIESELDAIERVEEVKQFHKENAIKKSNRFYDYLKLQIMSLNDTGTKKLNEHIFKDTKGNNLNIILN